MALLCLRRGDDSYDGVSSFLFINLKQNENRTVVDAVVSGTRKFEGCLTCDRECVILGRRGPPFFGSNAEEPCLLPKGTVVLRTSICKFALENGVGLGARLSGCRICLLPPVSEQEVEETKLRTVRKLKMKIGKVSVSRHEKTFHFELLTDLHKGLRIR